MESVSGAAIRGENGETRSRMHLQPEMKRGGEREIEAFILAGGRGTRLGSLAGDLSKPMVPIDGKPFLEYLLVHLRNHGIKRVTISVGYRADSIESYFGSGDQWDVEIRYSHDRELLGTGGAVKLAQPEIRSRSFLVLNGDSFCDIDLSALVDYHNRCEGKATIALSWVPEADRFGAVQCDSTGAITAFVEKQQGLGPAYINAGVYVLGSAVFDFIPEGQRTSLENDTFPRLVGQGFYGMASSGFFVDIGTPDSYRNLQTAPRRLLEAIGGPG